MLIIDKTKITNPDLFLVLEVENNKYSYEIHYSSYEKATAYYRYTYSYGDKNSSQEPPAFSVIESKNERTAHFKDKIFKRKL